MVKKIARVREGAKDQRSLFFMETKFLQKHLSPIFCSREDFELIACPYNPSIFYRKK